MTSDDHHASQDQLLELTIAAADLAAKNLRIPERRVEDIYGTAFEVVSTELVRIMERLDFAQKSVGQYSAQETAALLTKLAKATVRSHRKFCSAGLTSHFKKKESKYPTNLIFSDKALDAVRPERLTTHQHDVWGAMHRLRAREQKTVYMYYFEGRNEDEIACELKTSRKTVSRSLVKGRAFLKAFLSRVG